MSIPRIETPMQLRDICKTAEATQALFTIMGRRKIVALTTENKERFNEIWVNAVKCCKQEGVDIVNLSVTVFNGNDPLGYGIWSIWCKSR